MLGRRVVIPGGLSMLLAGCGFHPVFAPGANGSMGAAQAELAAIGVGIIPDRRGQLLRQALQARFERGGIGIARRYDLAVAFALAGEGELVQRDASVTRVRITATASWTLLGQTPQPATLTTGLARAIDGYDIINNQFFAADMSNEEVSRRLANNLADQITLQLAGYFNRRASVT